MSEERATFKGATIYSPKYMDWQYELNRYKLKDNFHAKYNYILHRSEIPLPTEYQVKNSQDELCPPWITYVRVQHLEDSESVDEIFQSKLQTYEQFLQFGKEWDFYQQKIILKDYPEFGNELTIMEREHEFKNIKAYHEFVKAKDIRARELANNYESLIQSLSDTLGNIYKAEGYGFEWSEMPNDWGSVVYNYDSDEWKDTFYKLFPKNS